MIRRTLGLFLVLLYVCCFTMSAQIFISHGYPHWTQISRQAYTLVTDLGFVPGLGLFWEVKSPPYIRLGHCLTISEARLSQAPPLFMHGTCGEKSTPMRLHPLDMVTIRLLFESTDFYPRGEYHSPGFKTQGLIESLFRYACIQRPSIEMALGEWRQKVLLQSKKTENRVNFRGTWHCHKNIWMSYFYAHQI